MTIEKITSLGSINISEDAIATLTGQAITECYGVVGMASRHIFGDRIAELLRRENYGKGVVVDQSADGLTITVYIIVSFGVRISQVVQEVQKKVKYVLEKTLQIEIDSVNVFVQGVSKQED